MANRYVDFISDEHFLMCVEQLHNSYVKAKNKITKSKFYKNKIDTIKLTFDSKFNNLNEEAVIENEILRQIDKSINNSIGTFHEQILGGIEGFELGSLSGFDIKAENDTMFADIKNKHNTMNSSSAEALFQKLAKFADEYKQADCYWVQILAKGSFKSHWKGDINGKEYSHSRVFKISGDQFYTLLTGKESAFCDLYEALPKVISDFMSNLKAKGANSENSALNEIKKEVKQSKRSILNQITFDNFRYYKGFDEL